jgi:hypothetical protein
MEQLTAIIEQLKKDVATAVAEKLRPLLSRPEVPAETELDPFRLYTAAEAADVLGLDRATMYEIPEAELPRCNVGPARGATRWMGADLLAYARGADPIDYEVVLDELREELRKTPSSKERPPTGDKKGKRRVV